MNSSLQQVVFRHQRQTLLDLAELVPEAADLDAASFFEQFEEPEYVGFKDRGKCSGTQIVLPGPKEAEYRAHLHVEERFDTCAPHDLKFYRYEICWGCDFVWSPDRNDHLTGAMLSLRRGVRFDHHSGVVWPRKLADGVAA